MKILGLNSFIWIENNALEVGCDVKTHDSNSNQATITHAKHTKSHQLIHQDIILNHSHIAPYSQVYIQSMYISIQQFVSG